ncbi:hypothetical protein TRVL_10358 [Trypanosoma vivax]|nr:hypothetical protein TRVL_10358 [Trypanosoma vivax]
MEAKRGQTAKNNKGTAGQGQKSEDNWCEESGEETKLCVFGFAGDRRGVGHKANVEQEPADGGRDRHVETQGNGCREGRNDTMGSDSRERTNNIEHNTSRNPRAQGRNSRREEEEQQLPQRDERMKGHKRHAEERRSEAYKK